ncbi:TPA: hypothetical protein JA361_07270 [Legionella pneumophila]|nr:hypothetical protein [Legionella pneumophila]HAT8182037.1 hypothetical protein [Legionella pneumophila]
MKTAFSLNEQEKLASLPNYYLGVTDIHATAYIFLQTIQLSPLQNPLQEALERYDNLIQYCEHIYTTWLL